MLATMPQTEPSSTQASSAPPQRPARFTLDGSDELEWRLNRTCERVLAGVEHCVPGRRLEALILGGGYGRGEGGVLKTEAGDRPYNDLEFYVCLGGNRLWNQRRYEAALHALADRLSPAAGLEVEFKITSVAHLQHSPVSMFYHDLVMGHRWLGGNAGRLSGCEHHREAQRIPLSEATRLLMNRCSGLLFAREKLEHQPFTADDADFVGRNLAKAQLAFGDAVLTVFGRYHWSCLERHERLLCLSVPDSLPWLQEVRRHHAAGTEFKLHPWRTTVGPSILRRQHDELAAIGLRIWFWLESRRLGQLFTTVRDYALSQLNKCPETVGWRNLLVNAYALDKGAFQPSRCYRHPRERVLNALTCLLWDPLVPGDSMGLRHLQAELGTTARTFTELASAYRSLWQRFN
jgi:hypothetical protein